MQEVFTFWGYGPVVWHELVGTNKLIEIHDTQVSETKFGRVLFTAKALDLLSDFEKELEGSILSYVRCFSNSLPQGKVIAQIESMDKSECTPLITVDDRGGFRFYFDVDETIQFIQQEKYVETRTPFYVKLGVSPDGIPAILRKAILSAFKLSRSVYSLAGLRVEFPGLFKDFSVDVWRFLVRAIIEHHADRAYDHEPLWPDGKQYSVVLNHDVDTEWGFKNTNGIESFREIEEKRGLRSAWMVVAQFHQAVRENLVSISDAGHEIGYHGTVHDHSFAYLPEDMMRERISVATPFLTEFNCTGFRSPSYHRTQALYGVLSSVFQYDMSMHDCCENLNSPLPSFEGCSTCFPFKIDGTDVLEIPTTITEDIVLELNGLSPEKALEVQLSLVEIVKNRQGVANILTHPEPQLSARSPWIQNYDILLDQIIKDESAWITLPRELCRWWNQRQEKIRSLWQESKACISVRIVWLSVIIQNLDKIEGII